MNTLRTVLRDADPLATDDRLTPPEVERMRQQVTTAAAVSAGRPRLRVALAAGLALTAIAGGLWGRRAPAPAPTPAAQANTHDTGAPRQLQFATPGGTRVIWIFDDNFDKR